MENNIVFDNVAIISHKAYPKYCCKLNEISFRDSKRDGFNNKIICIDNDTYERVVYPHNLNNTMDATIGICNWKNNKRVNKRFLLVELRLNYKSSRRFSGTELKNKSSHTRDLLVGEIDIDPNDIFIYDDTIINEAKRRIYNLAKEHGFSNKWHPMTIDEFNNLIKDAENIPYTPINSPRTISGQFNSVNNDIEMLIRVSAKWLDEARKYIDKYNFQEANIICETAVICLKDILDKIVFNDKDSLWYIEEFIDDFERIKIKSSK